jgi:hypothetical protein
LLLLVVKDAPYAPWTTLDVGTCRPHAFSSASDISPTVHLSNTKLMYHENKKYA